MKRGARLTSFLLIFICLSLAALTAWQVWSSRERALHAMDVANRNLVQALDNYSEGVIRQSELVLLDLVEHLQHDGQGPAQLARLTALLQAQRQVLGQAQTIAIYDAQGDRLLASNGNVEVNVNSADRAFFQHHRNDPSPGIFIGPTIKSRFTDEWVFTVSRRLEDGNGQFAGVVVINLGVEHFLTLFGGLDVGKQGAMSLSTRNGQLLLRYPFREQDVGLDWSASPLLPLTQQQREGSLQMQSRIDGTERLYAFRSNQRLPLVTVVALGRDEALTTWRRDAQLFATLILLLLVAVSIIGQRLIVDIRRRARAERQLLATREELLDANSRLEVLASQDTLTGLANRRSFDQTLEIEVRRAQRRGTSLALLLLDVDLFKRYNDRYGHVAGDACLRAVAEVLRHCVRRPGDLAARYGGEELAVILPNTDLQGAHAVAQTCMELLEKRQLAHEASPFQRVTASIGLASVLPAREDDKASAVALIQAADQALYRAKANGRNRVEGSEPPDA